MWRQLTALFRTPAPEPSPEPAGVLVLYGLPAEDTVPTPQTPSLVLPSLDPEDGQRCFQPTAALQQAPLAAFVARLDTAPLEALRDPNSRARLGFIRRWLDEVSPAAVAWLLEPDETAGDGSHWSR